MVTKEVDGKCERFLLFLLQFRYPQHLRMHPRPRSPPFVFFPCLVFDDNFVVVFGEKALTRVFSSLDLTFVYVPAKKINEIEPKSCSIHLVHHHPFFRRRPA